MPNSQPPQFSCVPQPFVPVPHCQPSDWHVSQHTWLPLHVAPFAQAGQVTDCPQLSVPVPHCQPSCAHVFDWHPQTFACPVPPQTLGAVQLPQLTSPPQPSLT